MFHPHADFEAALAGQDQIENDEIGFAHHERGLRLSTILGNRDPKLALLEKVLQERGFLLVVLDNEDEIRDCRMLE